MLRVTELPDTGRPGAQPPSGGTAEARLEALFARIESDARRHTIAGPSPEPELAQLEAAIGHALPAPFRMFLARLGGGLYYERHEVFGPLRAMIHDIEIVPPLRHPDFAAFLRDVVVPRQAAAGGAS